MDLRRLAYSVVEKLAVQHPFSHENKMAGYDWLRGFLARHEDLSVRGTNTARTVAFNRVNVNEFFMAYKELLENHTYTNGIGWNMDETGITNVHAPGNVIVTKGIRQVGKMTSGVRGTMKVSGGFLPPMLIFRIV